MNAECGKKKPTLLFPPSQFRIHNSVFATPYLFRKHLLVGLVGLTVLTGMTGSAPAQCQLQKLLPTDGAVGDSFGVSVAISGDTAMIGAPSDDDQGGASGSAYVFERIGVVWTEVATTPSTKRGTS